MKKIKKGKFLIAFVFAILMCTANIFAAPEKDKEGATLDADTVEYDMKTGQAIIYIKSVLFPLFFFLLGFLLFKISLIL